MNSYLLTVAIHAVVFSAVGALGLALIRKPRPRAVIALASLIGICLLPWLSPLRPMSRQAVAIPIKITRVTIPEKIDLVADSPQEAESLGSEEPTTSPPSVRLQAWKISEGLIALWLAGAAAGLLIIMLAIIRTARWRKSLSVPNDHDWSLLRETLPDFDRNRVLVAATSISPCVIGFLRPRIVIPRSLLGETRQRELAWAMRHEFTHWQGHDSRWALAAALVRTLFWWNPFVHRVARCWSESREMTCDLAAAMSCEDRTDYGEFLITLASGLKPPAPFVPGMAAHASARRLKRRIATLLNATPGVPARMTRRQATTVALAFPAAFAATSLLALESPEALKKAVTTDVILEEILNPPLRLATSMTIVKSREPFCHHGEVLSREELDRRVKQATRQSGYEFFPLSGESDKFGTTAWTHLTAPFVVGDRSDELPWDGKEWTRPSIGWIVGRDSKLEGDTIHVSVQAAYAFVPGHHLAPGLVPETLIPWSKVQSRQLAGSAAIPSGQAAGFSFGEVEPGVHVCVVFGVAAIKPWDTPDLWSGVVPSIPPRNTANILPVPRPRSPRTENLVTREMVQKRQDAGQAWQSAMDALPANAELVRQREIHRQQLAGKPKDPELRWKLGKLEQAIRGNAAKEPAIRHLRVEYDRLFRLRVTHETGDSRKEFQQRETQKQERFRWEMEQFERQRHHW